MRKIYPQKIKDMSRCRPWTERVLRWAKMQSPELVAALGAAQYTAVCPAVCVSDDATFLATIDAAFFSAESAEFSTQFAT